jgi:hypothetical protein
VRVRRKFVWGWLGLFWVKAINELRQSADECRRCVHTPAVYTSKKDRFNKALNTTLHNTPHDFTDITPRLIEFNNDGQFRAIFKAIFKVIFKARFRVIKHD